ISIVRRRRIEAIAIWVGIRRHGWPLRQPQYRSLRPHWRGRYGEGSSDAHQQMPHLAALLWRRLSVPSTPPPTPPPSAGHHILGNASGSPLADPVILLEARRQRGCRIGWRQGARHARRGI